MEQTLLASKENASSAGSKLATAAATSVRLAGMCVLALGSELAFTAFASGSELATAVATSVRLTVYKASSQGSMLASAAATGVRLAGVCGYLRKAARWHLQCSHWQQAGISSSGRRAIGKLQACIWCSYQHAERARARAMNALRIKNLLYAVLAYLIPNTAVV
eukprot:scaffold6952_cov18-Tisochrysis_lutea.AAC.3